MLQRKKREFKFDKIFKVSIVINIIQILLFGGMLAYMYLYGEETYYVLLYMVLLLLVINSGITLAGAYIMHKQKKDHLVETIQDLTKLNTKLREQRHDYLNHLQVIYGLMALEEYDEAKQYMEPVYKDILKVSRALRTSHPAINALLQAKLQVAESRRIDMYLEIQTNLQKIALEPWELCKVLSNIIDNAIHALDKDDTKQEKIITLAISETLKQYTFHISNNGPAIPHYYLRQIFQEGFTTQKGEGHGMGLFITKTIIEQVGGTIEATSNKDKTYFTIEIPKQA